MIYAQKALSCVLVLHGSLQFVHSREVEGHASPGEFILLEESDSKLSYYGTSVSINSNVPVTVQRYYDDMYLEGNGPVMSDEAKVLVTSDCSATTYALVVSFGEDSIDVNVQGALGGAEMSFFESSSYSATWNVTSYWCEEQQWNPPAPAASIKRILGTTSSWSIMSLFKLDTWTRKGPKIEIEEDRRNTRRGNCNVNVEVLLDGCAHGVDVSAPKVRVFDATVENASSRENAQNQCVYDYEADIMFSPTTPAIVGTGSLDTPALDDGTFDACIKAVPGRPFMDSTGSTIQAPPLIATTPTVVGGVKSCPKEDVDGTSSLCVMESYPSTNNSSVVDSSSSAYISQNQLLLGQEWTKNAIGEHASVASFSAFSIALMTNQAPADLLQDALEAALDEVRHAETSFDIASKLMGQEVQPGPLPESKHEFGQNTKALAMAVAKEGCVDETLSAFEAAAEVDFIDALLENNGALVGTKYADIDVDILGWIRDELRTIALEESGHAALAWRTVKWICRIDPEACSMVKQHILNEEELDRAFQRRFGHSFGHGTGDALKIMEESWKKLYSHVYVPARGTEVSLYDNISGESLVALMAKKVLQGVMDK